VVKNLQQWTVFDFTVVDTRIERYEVGFQRLAVYRIPQKLAREMDVQLHEFNEIWVCFGIYIHVVESVDFIGINQVQFRGLDNTHDVVRWMLEHKRVTVGSVKWNRCQIQNVGKHLAKGFLLGFALHSIAIVEKEVLPTDPFSGGDFPLLAGPKQVYHGAFDDLGLNKCGGRTCMFKEGIIRQRLGGSQTEESSLIDG
jgi:hypothetical protein